ncbi:MAG TPA: hypothetical protein VGK67_07685 [Myxococcales bacterium]
MIQRLMTVDETAKLIAQGAPLLLAGSEAAMRKLPKGEWVGGTIPYFMDANGGQLDQERVFVNELPDFVKLASIGSYGPDRLAQITADEPDHGFSVIVIPAQSPVHLAFAEKAPRLPDIYLKPLIGWIAGTRLEDLGKQTAKTFVGRTGKASETEAVVMHCALPKGKAARVDIINVFTQGDGDEIVFPETGFQAMECKVNGQKANFAEYLAAKKIDTRMPLVANYSGAMINTSFQSVDAARRTVHFYAPVFDRVAYKLARPIADYSAEFAKAMGSRSVNPVFCCNCILNYLYGSLEGKKTGSMVGPITFGEVAYQLVNQTMAYLAIV